MPKIERLFLGGFIYVYLFLVHKLIFEFFPTQKIKVYKVSDMNTLVDSLYCNKQ